MSRRLTALVVGAWLVAAKVSAQSVAGGALVQTYTFRDPTHAGLAGVNLVWAPFSAVATLGTRMTVDVSGGAVRGLVNGEGGIQAELTGVADTRMGLGVSLAGGGLVLRSEAWIPGSAGHGSLSEARVVGVIASDLLGLSPAAWAGAASVGGSAEVKVTDGPKRLAARGGYRRWWTQSFPGDATMQYRPGDAWSLQVSADVPRGNASVLTVVGRAEAFGPDGLDGASLFRSGIRIEGTASYAFPIGMRGAAMAYGGYRHRPGGTLLDAGDWLSGVADGPGRGVLVAGAGLRLPRQRLNLLPDAELRLARSAAGGCTASTGIMTVERPCQAEQGWMASVGGAVEFFPGGRSGSARVVVTPSARIRVGQLVRRGDGFSGEGLSASSSTSTRSGFVGLEAGLTVRARLDR